MAGRNDIGVSIFTLDIHSLRDVHHWSVDAPFESVRVIGNATKSPVRIGGTTVRLGAMELPLGNEVGVELCDIEWARWNTGGCTDYVANAAGRVAVEPRFLVIVVVLDHNRVGAAVGEDRRRGVPAEVEVCHDRTGCSVELD